MSEYIYRRERVSAGVWLAENTGEEIVRCRDCKYYDEIIHACERFDGIKKAYVSYVFDDGFCAWGERKVGPA